MSELDFEAVQEELNAQRRLFEQHADKLKLLKEAATGVECAKLTELLAECDRQLTSLRREEARVRAMLAEKKALSEL